MREALSRPWRAWILGVTTAFMAVALWNQLWSPPPALAQSPPDAGGQRLEMIKQLEAMNAKLGEVSGLLREIRDDARKAHPEAERPKRP